MGRKSKLSEKQWEAIAQRYAAGESARKLGEEFKISESCIRDRLSAQTAQIKIVANQLVTAEQAFKALPFSAQITAQSLAERLRSVGGHLVGTAEYGAATAHRLSAIAHSQVQFLDDADPLDETGVEKLKVIAALTRTANEATATGIALINANKDRMNETPPLARTIDPKKLSDATLKELLTSRA